MMICPKCGRRVGYLQGNLEVWYQRRVKGALVNYRRGVCPHCGANVLAKVLPQDEDRPMILNR